MALAKLTDIQKIARDCYTGNVEKYSKNAANDVLRAEIIERVGGEWTYTNFQKNKWDVYALLQEVIDVDLVNLSEEAFKQFCETKNIDLGDANSFWIEGANNLIVSEFSGNHFSIKRQRVEQGSEFIVSTRDYGISVYAYIEQ